MSKNTLSYRPNRYHPAFSTVDAAVKIDPGTIVSTTLLDAHGFDASGQRQVDFSNPLTGPFYINNALPADTLAVSLISLKPDRSSAWSKSAIAAHLLTQESDSDHTPPSLVNWQLDLHSGLASLDLPGREAQDRLSIPITPILGCIGTAPPHKAVLSSYISSSHGGNMDHPFIQPGTTIYLPVFTPGGLLFVGDGHAAQSDGEISGAALEVSCSIEFHVTLRKGWSINTPRGETNALIFTLGCDFPLENALRIATSEMLLWLQQDYGLTREAAHLLMSQCVKYTIGNLVSEHYSVGCALAKQVLPHPHTSH